VPVPEVAEAAVAAAARNAAASRSAAARCEPTGGGMRRASARAARGFGATATDQLPHGELPARRGAGALPARAPGVASAAASAARAQPPPPPNGEGGAAAQCPA
jgi:hypothetical protein